MGEKWEIIIVNEVAEKEILKLSTDLKARFLHVSNLLVKLEPANIGMPHVKFLGDKLWEMRLKGKDNIARVVYFLAYNKKIVILHTFIKKTQGTPRRAIKIAQCRIKEVENGKI
jgi:phage-related protein